MKALPVLTEAPGGASRPSNSSQLLSSEDQHETPVGLREDELVLTRAAPRRGSEPGERALPERSRCGQVAGERAGSVRPDDEVAFQALLLPVLGEARSRDDACS